MVYVSDGRAGNYMTSRTSALRPCITPPVRPLCDLALLSVIPNCRVSSNGFFLVESVYHLRSGRAVLHLDARGLFRLLGRRPAVFQCLAMIPDRAPTSATFGYSGTNVGCLALTRRGTPVSGLLSLMGITAKTPRAHSSIRRYATLVLLCY